MKRLIERIKKDLGVTNYGLAKRMGLTIGAVEAHMRSTANRPRIAVDILCKLREVSGYSWEEFGRLLDKEHGR